MARIPNTESFNNEDIIHADEWFDRTRRLTNIPHPANISVDKINTLSSSLPNVFIQVEPNAIIDNETYLINNCSKYHTILTYNETIARKCPNAKLYIFGTTWIPKTYYNSINTSIKQYKISTLGGSKLINNSPGHVFRQLIHHNQDKLRDYPITFFRSERQKPHITDYGNNPFLTDDKTVLFDTFQFAIIIENSRQTNYASEKIMDCVITKTIPIYWGCPNIGSLFDISGWIILESGTIEELHDKLRILDKDYYHRYTNAINKNYDIALKYVDFYDNLNNAV